MSQHPSSRHALVARALVAGLAAVLLAAPLSVVVYPQVAVAIDEPVDVSPPPPTTTPPTPPTTPTTPPPTTPPTIPPATPPSTLPPVPPVLTSQPPPELPFAPRSDSPPVQFGPTDGQETAQAELDLVRARLAQLAPLAASTKAQITKLSADIKKARHDRVVIRHQRIRRAVSVYRSYDSGDVLANMGLDLTGAKSLEKQKAQHLLAASDEAEVIRDHKLRTKIKTDLASRVSRAAELATILSQQDQLTTLSNALVVKLADLVAGAGLVGPQVVAPAANTAIAKAAVLAQEARRSLRIARVGLDPVVVAQATVAWQQAAMNLATYVEVAAAPGSTAAVPTTVVPGSNPLAAPAALAASWDSVPEPAVTAVLFALTQIGKPYIYATAGPTTYDCSGLTKRAWAEAGVWLPHFSGAQLRTGTPVATADIRPGDLLTYGPSGADHVTLSIGAGLVAEAKGRAYGLIVSPARTALPHFAGASRPSP